MFLLSYTGGVQKVRRLIQRDIINFTDIVLLVISTICRYNITQPIIRQDASHYYVDAAYCYTRSSVVCLSIGRSVGLSQSCDLQKRLNRSKCRLGCGLGMSRNHVLDGGPDTHAKG